VVGTFGGMHALCACKRTAQLTAQAGNVLEPDVGTMLCEVATWRSAIVANARRKECDVFGVDISNTM
jgi:hypothetical protein